MCKPRTSLWVPSRDDRRRNARENHSQTTPSPSLMYRYAECERATGAIPCLRAFAEAIVPFPLSSYRASASSAPEGADAAPAPEEDGTEQTTVLRCVLAHPDRMLSSACASRRSIVAPRPSSRIRRPNRGRCPDLVVAEANDVETCPEVFAELGKVLGSPVVGATDLQVRLVVPRTKGVSTTSRTSTRAKDIISLHLRELRTKRLNLRHRDVARREAERKRMLTRNDTASRVLSSRYEHHRARFRKVALDRHGSPYRPKTRDESPSVIHREVEGGLQRLRMQARLLERRPKRGCGRRIEPEESEDGRMRRWPTTWTAGRARRLVGTRGHHEQERRVQEAAPGGFGG